MMTTTETNILHWNCNGIRNKKIDFFNYLISKNIHIACLNETKLDDSIRLNHNQFRVIRLSRSGEGTAKGGVAIVLHKSVKFSLLSSFDTELVEALGVVVDLCNGQRLRLIAVYLTGTASTHDYDAYRRDIRRLTIPNSLILGDLNSKHSYWGCQRENRAGRILFEEMMRSNFEVHFPPSPTFFPSGARIPAALDIALSTTQIQFEPIQVADDLGSDHLPIFVQILNSPQTQIYNQVRSFGKARWDRYKQYLNRNIDLNYFKFDGSFTMVDIDDRIAVITEIFKNAVEVSVPLITIRPQYSGMNSEISTLIRQRRATKKHLQRNNHPLVRQMYNNVKRRIEKLCNDEYNRRFQDLLGKMKPNYNNNRKLWSLSKILKGKRSLLPFLKVQDRELITDTERAEALADTYQANH